MSGMRLTIGIIAQLQTSVGDFNQEEHQALGEYLESINSPLRLTYGGDMVVYIDSDKRTDYEETGLTILDPGIMEVFEMELEKAGLFVFQGTPQVFVDHWYDGCDPPHIDITLEDAGYSEDM